LAKAFGVNPSQKNGGVGSGIVYLAFPGSGQGWPKTANEIQQIGSKLLKQWGGLERLKALPSTAFLNARQSQ
jgi:hypothetical protein